MSSQLGVNLDHVATLARLRDTAYPSLIEAARISILGGADQITIHLREDRRHIIDEDVYTLCRERLAPINLEMACSEDILQVALKARPDAVCLVPEKREERTTEGGLNLSHGASQRKIISLTEILRKNGIKVSYFIEPSLQDVERSKEFGADSVEFHTGSLCLAIQNRHDHGEQLNNLIQSAKRASDLGLGIHAGHGIDENCGRILVKECPLIEEYNIGHFLICQSVFWGLQKAVSRMKRILNGEIFP